MIKYASSTTKHGEFQEKREIEINIEFKYLNLKNITFCAH